MRLRSRKLLLNLPLLGFLSGVILWLTSLLSCILWLDLMVLVSFSVFLSPELSLFVKPVGSCMLLEVGDAASSCKLSFDLLLLEFLSGVILWSTLFLSCVLWLDLMVLVSFPAFPLPELL